MYAFLQNEQLLNPNQSGFRSSDSCLKQLLSITHEILQSFDPTPPLEVRSVFLDISKAFDKVWHEGLLYEINFIGISGKFYKLMESYLSDKFQIVVLNGETSSWTPILAGIPQGSILGSLLFLIYINVIPDSLKSNVKLFADDTSIFSIVKNKNDSANDLLLISKWAFKLKMPFNPDHTKPAQEVIFSREKGDSAHPDIFFNMPVERASHQKHLDEKLNFKMHIETVLGKGNKWISLIKKVRHTLPRKSLLTIYKAFLRPHIDYGNIICDLPFNESFCEKLESIQYKAALAITGAIQGTSREKILELDLESLKSRRWFRHLCCMFEIMKNEAPEYLNNLILKRK